MHLMAIIARRSLLALLHCAVRAGVGEDYSFIGDAAPASMCALADTSSEAVCGLVYAAVKDLVCGAHVEKGCTNGKMVLQ